MPPERPRSLLVLLAAVLLGATGCTLPTASDGSGYGPPPATVAGAAQADPTRSGAVAATPSELRMVASAWTPARFAVKQGTPLTLQLVNTDPTWHNLTFQPARISQNVAAGGQVTVRFPALLPGDHVFWCKYHRKEMRGWVVVR